MQKNDYISLKSGTDVRGIAVEQDIVTEGARLDATAAYDIAAAFVFWLRRKTRKKRLSVAVGHDSRITAQPLSEAVIDAFKASGCIFYSCGLMTTPAMFMMTKFPSSKCDGAIMITASHHPYYMNGLKFFTRRGGISSTDLQNILQLASEGKQICSGEFCENTGDFLANYVELLKSQITVYADNGRRPLEGMKIVVDAGNGATGFFAHRVLSPLGADTSGSQFLDADGYFPNHVPNPEDKEAIRSLKECVLKNNADLGIIFDTDGDRMGIVTADGNEINRNRLIAVSAAILLEQANGEGCTIVTDSVTSDGLTEFIKGLGGKHFRYMRGYRNVINKACELCYYGENAALAIETSGHAAFKENYFLDDGAYLAVRMIAKAVRLAKQGDTLSGLIEGLREPVQTIEARLKLKGKDWKTSAVQIIDDLTSFAEQNFEIASDSYEGVRGVVANAKGWFLLRISVHDPVMPLNIESDIEGGASQIALLLLDFFHQYECLDVSSLQKSVNQ